MFFSGEEVEVEMYGIDSVVEVHAGISLTRPYADHMFVVVMACLTVSAVTVIVDFRRGGKKRGQRERKAAEQKRRE